MCVCSLFVWTFNPLDQRQIEALCVCENPTRAPVVLPLWGHLARVAPGQMSQYQQHYKMTCVHLLIVVQGICRNALWLIFDVQQLLVLSRYREPVLYMYCTIRVLVMCGVVHVFDLVGVLRT